MSHHRTPISSLVQLSLIDRFPGHSQFTTALCPTDETEARNTNTNRGGQNTPNKRLFVDTVTNRSRYNLRYN